MKTFEDLFKKTKFDATNLTHFMLFQRFLETGKWSGCPFKLEEEYESVPGMIFNKIYEHQLKKILEKHEKNI